MLFLGNAAANCGCALKRSLRGRVNAEAKVGIVFTGDGAVGRTLGIVADTNGNALIFDVNLGLNVLGANEEVDGVAVVIAAFYVVGISKLGIVTGQVVQGNQTLGHGPAGGSLNAPAAEQAREETVP